MPVVSIVQCPCISECVACCSYFLHVSLHIFISEEDYYLHWLHLWDFSLLIVPSCANCWLSSDLKITLCQPGPGKHGKSAKLNQYQTKLYKANTNTKLYNAAPAFRGTLHSHFLLTFAMICKLLFCRWWKTSGSAFLCLLMSILVISMTAIFSLKMMSTAD